MKVRFSQKFNNFQYEKKVIKYLKYLKLLTGLHIYYERSEYKVKIGSCNIILDLG